MGQTGWFQVGGTSAGSPVWAGIVAAADSARAANGLGTMSSAQTLNLLYGLYGSTASKASTYATSFHDEGAGVNFAGWAVKGYDLVTGLGSPVASSIVAAASRTNVALTVVHGSTVAAATSTTTVTQATAVSPTGTTVSVASGETPGPRPRRWSPSLRPP